jgi:hypothetical protein
MLRRIRNPNFQGYENYGGRGLDVDPRWGASFEAFLSDMGERPTPEHSIERKNNSRGYWPDNCVWATTNDQQRNKRDNVRVMLRGTPLILNDALRVLNVNHSALWKRMRNHKESHQQALNFYATRAS